MVRLAGKTNVYYTGLQRMKDQKFRVNNSRASKRKILAAERIFEGHLQGWILIIK